MAEISPPDCGSSDCPTASPLDDKNRIIFTNLELSTEKIIFLNTLKPEINEITSTELFLNLNI